MLKKPTGWFDAISDERNGVIAAGFLICGLALVKFDTSARLRAKKQFEYDLAEYEKMRTNWLELQASKLEMEKQDSMQHLLLGQSTPLIVEDSPPISEETGTSEKPETETND